MRISGYSEFENIRKAVQKDDQPKKKAEDDSVRLARQKTSDQADVSTSARMFLMRDKAVKSLEKIPDPREDKVKEVLEKLEKGTLMTPDAVKESIGRMIDRGIVF